MNNAEIHPVRLADGHTYFYLKCKDMLCQVPLACLLHETLDKAIQYCKSKELEYTIHERNPNL